VGGGSDVLGRQHYAVARDGRFLINQPVENINDTPITLILNWRPERKP